jgi:anti-sigma factor RsiW
MDPDPMAELPAELKQNMTRYKAPPGLKRRVRYMLAQQSRAPGVMERMRASFSRWLPLGASFACGALLAVAVVNYHQGGPDEEAIEEQVVASHVRSLMAGHITDVASTDQHTVKPWFTGKLGGRLDYLEDRPVAALVYRRRGHTINLFVLPAHDARPSASGPAAHHGYQIAHWDHGGMRFWAVSDIGRDDMDKFAAALKSAM